jgi:hypothetical protein
MHYYYHHKHQYNSNTTSSIIPITCYRLVTAKQTMPGRYASAPPFSRVVRALNLRAKKIINGASMNMPPRYVIIVKY